MGITRENSNSRIITILEASVNEGNWEALQKAYNKFGRESTMRPTQSFLIQNKETPTLWRIVSIWKNMESLQKVKQSKEPPTGILIFRAAGAEPKLEIFEAKEEL